MKVSVIMTCWKRFKNIEKILQVFLNEPEVDEVIIWDNSGEFKTTLPVTVIHSTQNYGANIRFAVASFAKNEIIMTCDDDILPKPGIVSEFLKHYTENTALGIYGRNFDGSYKKGEHIYAEKITEPKEVEHIVGYLLMLPKWMFLSHDYFKFPWYCGEVELFGLLLKKGIQKKIIPTDKFENLSESTDEHSLSLHPDAPAEYEKIWEKYFKKGE